MKDNGNREQGEIVIYQTEDGSTKIDVRFEHDTVWLTQQQMAVLFQTSKQNVSLHIRNCFNEGELEENSVVKESLPTASDGVFMIVPILMSRLWGYEALQEISLL